MLAESPKKLVNDFASTLTNPFDLGVNFSVFELLAPTNIPFNGGLDLEWKRSEEERLKRLRDLENEFGPQSIM